MFERLARIEASGERALRLVVVQAGAAQGAGAQLVWHETDGIVAHCGFAGGSPPAALVEWLGREGGDWLGREPATVRPAGLPEWEVYVEAHGSAPRLLICGAGHIAQPLSAIAARIGYTVWIYDDRPEYATAARFPDAARILCAGFDELCDHVAIDARTWVVVVTRGHLHDALALETVLKAPAPYIGMIGSQRRVRTVVEDMLRRGHPVEALARIYAPIGLDIRARTPAEIAVAIAAELINVRRGGAAPSLRTVDRLLARARKGQALVEERGTGE